MVREYPRGGGRLRLLAAAVTPLVVLVASVGACSSSSSSSSDDAGTSSGTDGGAQIQGSGDPNVLVGTFKVRVVAPTDSVSGTTSFIGKVYDGASLAEVIWESAAKEGDCELFTPRVPFCNTPCGGSSACVENDTCKAYPIARSAGAVTVTGLASTTGATSFVASPIVNSYQPPAGFTLAYPPFAEGAPVNLEAAGDYYAPFAIEAQGVSPLVIPDGAIPIAKGSPLALTWTPPTNAGASTIGVKLDISHHGGSRGKIECTTADDGSLAIGATLIDGLVALGVAGFPTVILERRVTGSTTIAPGRVDLVIAAEVERAVTLDGLTSCNDDTQCPDGQTCQSDLSCQ